MSVAGGKADEISAKADIVTRLSLSERSRQLLHGARPVVTVLAWRASAERPDFVARATRLYEQEPGEVLASARLGYVAFRPTPA